MQTFATQQMAIALSDTDQQTFPAPSSPEFDEALSDTLSKPERLAAKLASARAEARLQDQEGSNVQAQTWGALLGAELSATRPYWLGQEVVVLGDGGMAQGYQDALAAQGVSVRCEEVERFTLAGLIAARDASG